MRSMPTLLLLLILAVVHSYPDTAMPDYLVSIIPSQSTTLRVYCSSNDAYDVSFQPDQKCEDTSCGYYDKQNTCCKVFEITREIVIECFQSSNRKAFVKDKSIKFVVPVIQPQNNVIVISNQNRSVLTCLVDTQGMNELSHYTDSTFYIKYAYLYNGDPREFGIFQTLKPVPLPANEATVLCNQTSYKFEHNNSEVRDSFGQFNEQMALMIDSHYKKVLDSFGQFNEQQELMIDSHYKQVLLLTVLIFILGFSVIIVLCLCLVWVSNKKKFVVSKLLETCTSKLFKRGQNYENIELPVIEPEPIYNVIIELKALKETNEDMNVQLKTLKETNEDMNVQLKALKEQFPEFLSNIKTIISEKQDQNHPEDPNAPGDQKAPGDQSAPGDQNAPGDQSAPGDQGAPEEESEVEPDEPLLPGDTDPTNSNKLLNESDKPKNIKGKKRKKGKMHLKNPYTKEPKPWKTKKTLKRSDN